MRIAVAILILSLALAAGSIMLLSKAPVPRELMAVLRPNPVAVSPFVLIDQQENEFNRESLLGRWSLLFFGYTFCPDICPTTLSTMKSALGILAQQADPTTPQVLFVSVDPARDTPQVLNTYLNYFDSGFVGLSGDAETIKGFAMQFGAGYVLDEPDDAGYYQVSHTSSIFLIDPQGNMIASFSPPHDASTVAEQIAAIKGLQ